MKPTEIVKQFMAALESGDRLKVASYLSDDFAFSGPMPLASNADEYLELQRALEAAFPDRSFNLGDVREEAGVVNATVRFTGTHTGELRLPMPDLPAVPPTGRSVYLPLETHLFTVRGSKIGAIQVRVVPGGGFQGMYRQLGVRLPVPSAVEG